MSQYDPSYSLYLQQQPPRRPRRGIACTGASDSGSSSSSAP